MANPSFPAGLAAIQDSKFYDVSQEDVGMKTPLDGGYVASRPRHTRTPRKTFTSGFTSMTNAQKIQLQAFYDTVKGSSLVFDWIDPPSGTVYTVRFTGELKIKYVGLGPTKLWDCSFQIEQA
jgi:hypothetical protein